MRFHRHEVPSAGTRSGMIWRRQPNTTSGSIWPMTWRMHDRRGLRRIEDAALGADTVSGPSEPALFGICARHHAAEPEHRVGGGVGERHVDAAARLRRRAGVVDMDAAVATRSARPAASPAAS